MAKREPMLPKGFKTVRGVADYCCISEKTVRRWIEDGSLRHYRLGRAIRIADEDLEDFLSRHR